MTETSSRGRTVIHDRVERRLAEHAALAVPEVRRHRGLAKRTLPSAVPESDGHGVDVQIATTWPVDTEHVIGAVRDSVTAELEHSLGRAPEKVVVHVVRADGERTPAQVSHIAGTGAPDDASRPARGAGRKVAPRRTDGASLLAVPVLIAVLVLGGVAFHDALIAQGWLSGNRWLDGAVGAADDVGWDWWTWPVAIGSIVLGVALLVLALKPRRRSHVYVTDDLWLRPDFAAEKRIGRRKEMR